MSLHKHNNKNLNEVNAFYEFIQEEEQKDLISVVKKKKKTPLEALELKYSYFFELVPAIQKKAVWWQINNRYAKDVKAYIDSKPNFLKYFSKKLCHTANSIILVDEKEKRKLKKRKKEALLYSSQLLGLVGFGGANYLNNSLLDYYDEDRQEQENFLANHKLLSKNGKFKKLTSLDVRERRQEAQILNLSDCLSRIAEDRGWTFTFLTLTLPGEYHANPLNGNSKNFNGVMPLEGYKRLRNYWKRIRANFAHMGLKAHEDYMGAVVSEGHKSSHPHLHSIIYHSKEHSEIIRKCITSVSINEFKKNGLIVNFKIIKSNGKASGSSYLFKYVFKTTDKSDKDAGKKNRALRWYLSARAFSFFGIENVVSKFNFVCENKTAYLDFFRDDLKKCLKKFDYYTFLLKYHQYFKTVRNKNGVINFVEFDLTANDDIDYNYRMKYTNIQRVIIKKNIYCLLEMNSNLEKVDNVNKLDTDDISNLAAFNSLALVKNRYQEYTDFISDYKKLNSQYAFISRIEDVQFNVEEDMKEYCVFDDPEFFGDFAGNWGKDKNLSSILTLKQSYSSKDVSRKRDNTHYEEFLVRQKINIEKIAKEIPKIITQEDTDRRNEQLQKEYAEFLMSLA